MKPRIVILEAIHADGIERMRVFADVDVRLGLPVARETIADADAIIVKSVTKVDEQLLNSAPRLRAVGRAGVGLDNIDADALRRRGIALLATPDGNTIAVAELTIGLILALIRNIPQAVRSVAAGDFRRQTMEGRELASMTVGIVGLGRAGLAVAQRLAAFGCPLIGHDVAMPDPEAFRRLGGQLTRSLADLLARSNVVTLHVPLTSETRGLINHSSLRAAKPGMYLVNTARGPIVDNDALLDALNEQRVSGAAIDVLYPEPPFSRLPGDHSYDHPLLHDPRILVTPHIGASTIEAQRRIALELAARLEDLIERPGVGALARG